MPPNVPGVGATIFQRRNAQHLTTLATIREGTGVTFEVRSGAVVINAVPDTSPDTFDAEVNGTSLGSFTTINVHGAIGTDEGSGVFGLTPAVIFDDVPALPAGSPSNITTSRSSPAPIDNTSVGITSLGTRSGGGATGATANYASILGGDRGTASGTYSTVSGGLSNTASGSASHAEGNANTASGAGSHAEGGSCTASGAQSHAEGSSNVASGAQAHAEGSSNTASGTQAHVEGFFCVSSAHASHAEGSASTASALGSHCEGNDGVASGVSSHCEGASCVASGLQAHAEGGGTTASGQSSHAEGNATQATGDSSHSEGSMTLASGEASHARGIRSVASRQTQSAYASGALNANGDAQTSVLVFRGSTTGSDPGESVDLLFGGGAIGNGVLSLELEDDKAYTLAFEVVALGSIAAARETCSFFVMVNASCEAGVATVNEVAPVMPPFGTAAAKADWTFTVAAGAGRQLDVTFTTGGTTAITNIVATCRLTETLFTAPPS